VLPDRFVPVGWTAFELLGTPDVVDKHIDATEIPVQAIGQRFHARRLEVIGGHRHAGTAETRDEVRGFLDRLGPVVFGSLRTGRPASTDHRRSGFAERGRDTAPRASRRAGDNGDLPAQRLSIRRPGHLIALQDSIPDS
jgi:hypothetical protein